MADMSSSFGANVRKHREKAGHSQESLARELDVAWITVSRWERGISAPSVDVVYRLAGALGCRVEDLITGSPA